MRSKLSSFPRLATYVTLCFLLSACATSSPQIPLLPLPQTKGSDAPGVLWRYSMGSSELAVLSPAITREAVFVASESGVVSRLEEGRTAWRRELGQKLSAGVGADNARVAVASGNGKLLVLSAASGQKLWEVSTESQVTAPPLVLRDLIIVRSGSFLIQAFNAVTGEMEWRYKTPLTTALSLRNYSPLTYASGVLVSGFPGGKMVVLHSGNGQVLWEGIVAISKGVIETERIVDVVASPILFGKSGCASAYQGRLACFNFSGIASPSWVRAISSYAGMTEANGIIFITADDGTIFALNRESGRTLWRQPLLSGRKLTRPLAVSDKLVVADAEGYVHLLDVRSGEYHSRRELDGAILAHPVKIGDTFIVQTQAGSVYQLQP